MPRIKTTYDVVTPESAEQGDFADQGWIDDDVGHDCFPDSDDMEEGLTSVDLAIRFLTQNGPLEASSSAFHPGVWYTQSDGSVNYCTGAQTRYSFHLHDFTSEAQAEIYAAMTKR